MLEKLLLSLVIVTIVSKGCEEGECVGGVCKCKPGWIGNDCSVPLTDLASGESIEAAVETNSWNYYRISVPGGALSATLVGLDEGNANSDCDLFVKYSKLPTAYDYDGRDTGWGSNAHVEIKDAAAGDWYIGVFGSISRCRYTLYATTEGNCPGGCSNNGKCVKRADGYTCSCNPGYTGDHCNEYLDPHPLLLNVPFDGHTMFANAWTNYFFDIQQEVLKIDVMVNITSATLCDFYINRAHAPDFTHWAYISPDNQRNFVITMQAVQAGTWFLGIFTGQSTCTYRVTLKTQAVQCTGECSHRGTCGPPCICGPDYSGEYCEFRQPPLTDGTTDGGFVDINLFHYYKYNANGNNNINVHIDQAQGDCDLYIKYNAPPTLHDYDEMDISNSTSFDLVITDAVQDLIYIAVFGYEACTYTIVITEVAKDETCQNGKSCIHGTCQGNDGCVCNPGWLGEDCTSRAMSLSNAIPIRGAVTEQNQWLYYQYTVHNPTLLVTLKERTPQVTTTGYLYLLMSQDRIPTLREHDFANYSPTSGFHTITIGLDNHQPEDFPIHFIIAIYGSPFVHDPVQFDLVAWEPEF